MKTLLITGISGFVGANAAKYFHSQGYRLVGCDSQPLPESMSEYIDCFECFALPSPALKELIERERPDFCLHCAGGASVAFSVGNPETDFKSHVLTTYSLLRSLSQSAPECKTIYLSSAAVYGNPKELPVREGASISPISPYGYHKFLSEQVCRQFYDLYSLKISVVRIFSAYGAGLKKQLLWDIYQKTKESRMLELHGTGKESRDFINIADIVRAFGDIFAAGAFDASPYNLATGEETTVSRVADLMLNYMNRDIPVIFKGDVRAGDPQNWRADVAKLKNIGFAPKVSLENGIEEYVAWCRGQST